MMLICAIRASTLSDALGKDDGGTEGERLILRLSDDRNICETGVRRGEASMSWTMLTRRREASLVCLDIAGDFGMLYILPASLPLVSTAMDVLRLLVVLLRKPETVDWNDFLDARDGVRGT